MVEHPVEVDIIFVGGEFLEFASIEYSVVFMSILGGTSGMSLDSQRGF
jgi:hypothetical protein